MKSPHRRIAVISAAFALLAIGAALGSLLPSRRLEGPAAVQVSAPDLTRPAALNPEHGAAERADLQAAEAQLTLERSSRLRLEAELQAVVAEREAALAAARAANDDPVRRPLPFPEPPPPGFAPAEFEAISKRVVAECGMGVALEALDCSEYPCMAWFRAEDLEQKRYSMEDCAPWTEPFGLLTGVIGMNVETDQGDLRLMVFYPLPKDSEAWRIVSARARERSTAMVETYGRIRQSVSRGIVLPAP